MRENQNIQSKIIAFENSKQTRDKIKSFCSEFNINGIIVNKCKQVLTMLKQNINIGAIILSDDEDITEVLTEIKNFHSEIPVFVRCSVENQSKWLDVFGLIASFYDIAELTTFKEIFSKKLFSRIYPEKLIPTMQTIVKEALESKFNNVNIEVQDAFLATDKRVYGDRIELMTVRSTWCEGIMMLQSLGADIDLLIEQGRTVFNLKENEAPARFTEDLLRELLNQIWGGFKSKYVPSGFNNSPSGVEVPLTVNHLGKYISFGSSHPLLCFKFNVHDELKQFPPFVIFIKFSFHMYWNIDEFRENPEIQTMVESGEIELF